MEPELIFKEDLEGAGRLNRRQVLFIAEFLAGKTVQEASLAAGYSAGAGYGLLKVPEVIAVIAEERRRQLAELEISAKQVLQELAKVAMLDVRKLFNDDGSPKSVEELDELTAKTIAGIDVQEIWDGRGEERVQTGVVKKYRFWDKMKALELLGKYHKLFTEVHEVHGAEALAEKLRKLRQGGS